MLLEHECTIFIFVWNMNVQKSALLLLCVPLPCLYYTFIDVHVTFRWWRTRRAWSWRDSWMSPRQEPCPRERAHLLRKVQCVLYIYRKRKTKQFICVLCKHTSFYLTMVLCCFCFLNFSGANSSINSSLTFSIFFIYVVCAYFHGHPKLNAVFFWKHHSGSCFGARVPIGSSPGLKKKKKK